MAADGASPAAPAAPVASAAEAIAAVMIADLRPSRQDELPLNRKPAKHVVATYAPTGNNGTAHIPKARKEALSKGWGKPIKDEESAQVETLELAECPWRRNQTRAVEIPGLFSQNQRQHGVRPLPMRDNTAPSQLVHRAPKIPPPTASTVNGTPTKEMAGLAIRDRTPPKAVAKIASGVTVPPVKPEEPTWGITGIGLDQCDFYFQPPESDKPVVYPYLGYCMVYPIAEDFSVRFVAKFAVELHLETAAEPNTALLHLETDGLESRVHDVSRMAAPRMSMDGTKCILRNEASSESEFSYRIGLKDQETTTLFVEAIEGLQKALRAVVEHQETAVVETTTVTPAPALETPPQSLVNLEPEPDTLGAIVGDAINAIRKNDNRSPQVKRHRHTSSDGQAFDDLSEAMFTDWKERAAIPNTPFMRDSFRDLLCVLMRIDHILEHPGAQDQPVMSEATLLLKSLEDKTNEGSKTIRYSADDMMHLRGNAVDRAEELSKKHFLPQKTPDVLTPKAGPQTIFRGIYTPSSIVNLQSGPSAHVQGLSDLANGPEKSSSTHVEGALAKRKPYGFCALEAAHRGKKHRLV